MTVLRSTKPSFAAVHNPARGLHTARGVGSMVVAPAVERDPIAARKPRESGTARQQLGASSFEAPTEDSGRSLRADS